MSPRGSQARVLVLGGGFGGLETALALHATAGTHARITLVSDQDHGVGSSRAWRMGKKVLGTSVPWRFAHGRPFHAGLFWRGMDAGLKVMAGALSD